MADEADVTVPIPTPRRRRTDGPWWAKALVTLAFAVALGIWVGSVFTSNARAERLVDSVCDVAVSVQDMAGQQREAVAQLRRQGDAFAAAIALLTAPAPERDTRERELLDLLAKQRAEVERQAADPALSPKVRRLCGLPSR